MGPSLTADALRRTLLDTGAIDPGRLDALLGPARHSPTLNQLEVALERSGALSRTQLLELIRAASGRDVLPTQPETLGQVLPERLARATGALVVSTEPLRVAMVEDLPEHIDRVAAQLDTRDFELVLITALQFDELRTSAYVTGVVDARPELTSLFNAFDETIAQGASDLHLKVGCEPTVRVDGATRRLPYRPITATWLRDQVVAISDEDTWRRLSTEYDVDFAYAYGPQRFRINLGMDRSGPTLVARKLSSSIPAPDELGLPRPVREFINLDVGIVLVVGATGSGKSTTLASLLSEMCRTQDRHVITLEQPIEFVLPSGRALVSQREMGSSFSTFAQGLRQSLRQDPDVILVGELRDLDTMRAAFNAAETGHLVFATVHAYDAISTLARVVNSFPADEQDQVRAQLSYVLKGVVAQKLLPLAHSRGRVAAHEVLLNLPSVAANLRKVDGIPAIAQAMETGVRHGMQTMDMSIAQLVSRNLVSFEVGERRSSDPAAFRRMVDQLGGVSAPGAGGAR
jgi:twitching motility protein PilT